MLFRPLSIGFAALFALTGNATAAEDTYYRVAFAAPVNQDRFVARDLLWACGGDGCTAGRSNSRPAIVCAALARSVGHLSAFSAGAVSFDTAALQKCNAAAS